MLAQWVDALDQFAACWEGLEDPRTGNAGLHDFHELLMIALCTVLCGGQGAVDMALFAKSKEPFLRGFLKLANGVPSHDTFSRLFRRLDPEQFRAAFQRFMAGFSEQCGGVVAIDGKVLRRSFDRASGKSPLHMVSAWGCEQRLVLAQVATDAKSNEITAIPALLKMLALKDTIVTTDALNCQRAIAQQIIECHPVHPWRSSVGTGEGIGVGEDVRPTDLVVQNVEAEGRLRLRLAVKLSLKAPDPFRCFEAHRQSPCPRHQKKAHQKPGCFPPPALPGLNGRTTLSVTRPGRRHERR